MAANSLNRSVAAAGFVFRARIHEQWTGEAPATPAEAGEVVATRIEEVLRSTPVLRGLAGQDALVVTKDAGTLRQLRSVILFTDCISLGPQLLLREIGHVETSGETSRRVAEAIREADERPLRERVAGAELIVTGEVVESQVIERAGPPKSEHDPLWGIARVTVKSVLKGRKPAGVLKVLFASSTDIAWFKAPKLYPGTSGIFLLRRAKEQEVPEAVPRTAYQVTDPLDLLPEERLAEIRRMLGE
jgi:hypothetical protein